MSDAIDAFLAAPQAGTRGPVASDGDVDAFLSGGADPVPAEVKARGRQFANGDWGIETPAGVVVFDGKTGQRVDTPKDVALKAAQSEALETEDALAKKAAFAAGAPLTRTIVGATEGAGAQRELDQAVAQHPGYEAAGSALSTLPAGLAETGLARVALQGGVSAIQGADKSKATDLGGVATDALKAGALGAGAGLVGEGAAALVSKGASKLATLSEKAFAQQAAKDAAAVEKEIASLRGTLGAETQKGSRFIENLQRGTEGIPQDIAGAQELAEGVLARNKAALPGQLKKIEEIEAELAAKQAGAAAEAQRRIAEYFAKPVWQELLPKLKQQAPRWGLAAVAHVLGGGSGFSTGVTLGSPGMMQMLRNIGNSARIQYAIGQRLAPILEAAGASITRGLTPTMAGLGDAVLNESHLGEPRLVAEQLLARGGLNSTIKAHPPDAAHALGYDAPHTELDKAIQQTAGIATLAGALDAHHDEVGKGVKAVLKGDRSPPKAEKHEPPKDVARLASDPEALLERVTGNTGNLHAVAPQVTAELVAATQRAVQHLAKVAGTPPRTGPLAPEWKQSGAERHALAKATQVVMNPMSILEHAKNGTLTQEHVAALKAVYPVLGRSIADKVVEQIADGKAKVPYRQRLMVHLLTGVDPDGTVGAVARNQQAIQRQSSKPSNAGAPTGPKGSAKGADKLSIASRTSLHDDTERST